jgi:hypothetical protein
MRQVQLPVYLVVVHGSKTNSQIWVMPFFSYYNIIFFFKDKCYSLTCFFFLKKDRYQNFKNKYELCIFFLQLGHNSFFRVKSQHFDESYF